MEAQLVTEAEKSAIAHIVRAARTCAPIVQGSTKVHIADVAARLGTKVSRIAHLLVKGNQAGLLTLSRCDLPEAFGYEKVSAGEVKYLNATFHFIRL